MCIILLTLYSALLSTGLLQHNFYSFHKVKGSLRTLMAAKMYSKTFKKATHPVIYRGKQTIVHMFLYGQQAKDGLYT